MELRELKYFLTISEAESISKAAQLLYVSQPNLTRQMQALERELGQKLFIRGTRKIVLTDAGKLLKKRAEDIVGLVEKTEEEFSTADEDIKGTISIGGGESYAVKRIARAAFLMREEYKSVKFSFFSGDTNQVTDKLDKGLLDFGVLIEPRDLSKYDTLKLPDRDTWGVLMRKDSPLADKKCIQKEDLLGLPLIISRHSFNENIISDWLSSSYEQLNVVAMYNLIYNASLMVAEGIGYAIGLDKLINTTGDSELCFKPLEPKLYTNLYIVWRKNTLLSKAAQCFLRFMKRAIEEKI